VEELNQWRLSGEQFRGSCVLKLEIERFAKTVGRPSLGAA
jgi:hypothetical protein